MFTQDPSGVYAASSREVIAALQAIEASDLGLVDRDVECFALDLFDAVDLHELHDDADDTDFGGAS
jgi:hypothetical protein